MSAAVFEREPGSAPAAVLSALVHVALFASLFFGLRWHSRHPDAVVVELWDRPAVVEPVLPEVPKPEPKPEPKVEPKPEPKVEARPEPKLQVKPPKPDIAVEKQKKAPPKKREEPKKVEPEVKIDYDRVMRERMAHEMEQVLRANRPPQPQPAGPVVDATYANKIKAKIRSNVVLPAGIVGNPEAIFDVVQLPTGEVLDPVRLRKSSGNRAYDAAVERAILKSSPLPPPDRPDQFVRELQLKFRPKE